MHRPRSRPALRALTLGLTLLGLAAGAVRATSLLPLTPEQVDAEATRIIEGRCVAARPVTVDSLRMPVTEYVFEVERVVKGEQLAERIATNGGTLSIRQVGGLTPEGHVYRIPGLPRYAVGSRYRLALRDDSPIGLTSPVGFGQGVQLLAPRPVEGATP